MATGETRTIDSDLTLTSKYEMTQYDDILNIIGATVTLSKPAGDIFTNEGNDTVTITNSTIKASASDLSFMLGSGNDTLNLQSSTIDAPILTGSGNDTVIISGDKQSKVTLKKTLDSEAHTLNLGTNADILEICATLEGDGDINFGVEEDTLRFNGGSLLTTGSLSRFCNLEVTAAGGVTGRNLTLTGLYTKLVFNGSLFGSTAGKVITIATSDPTSTTLTTADNIRTDVTWNLSNITLTQSEGGSLEFSGHTGYAVTANNSTVTLHDIVTESGNVFTGSNTNWKIKDSSFANSTTGMNLTSGTADLRNVNMTGYTDRALKLNGTKLTGADLAFNNNQGIGAIYAASAEMEITNLRMNENSLIHNVSTAVIVKNSSSHTTATKSATAEAVALGGGVYGGGSTIKITSGTISSNTASASAYISAYAFAGNLEPSCYAYATGFAKATALGGGIGNLWKSGNLDIANTDFLNNKTSAIAYGTATCAGQSGWHYIAFAYVTASASACGGAIGQVSGNLNIKNTKFSGNAVYATATGIASASGSAHAWAAGGACALIDTVSDLEDVKLNDNIASASASASPFWFTKGEKLVCEGLQSSVSYGGGLYLSNSTMNYTVTSGTKITNTGNQAQYGGFLYMEKNSTANLIVEDKAVLTIGDSTGKDTIGGDSTSIIQKQGNGYLLVNSSIADYAGVWTVYGGTVELARIARTIKLDNWTFGESGTLLLSSLDDTVNMTASKKISILDLGGGSDVINTNGYALSNGTLRISKLKFTGGGTVSSTITNRNAGSGFDLTLDDVVLNSDITGGDAVDKITITKASTLGGRISLGSGNNVITGTAAVTFQKTVQTVDGNDTLTFTSVTFDKDVMLGSGNNTFSAVTSQFNEGLYLGTGNDTVTFGKSSDNSGSVVSKVKINLGNGTNTLSAYCTADFATVAGGSGSDTIDLYKESTISGELELGGGKNVVYVEDTLTMTDGAVKVTEDGETRIIVYRGTTLTNNTLTVYADANAERETATYRWANQTDLDKVRLLVSSDSTFETFEFAVELYNKSKSFTLNLEKGYFVQFQANDEDGWKQRLLDDTVAPDQVTGVEFNGKTLTWDVTHDNLGGNGVKQYTVEVATDSGFTEIIDTRTVTETEYVPQGLEDGSYYFRVCAEDYTHNIGEWSTTVSGQLDQTPPTCPTGGQSSVNGYNVTFSWNAATDTGSGVAEYEYRVASDSGYETVIVSDTTENLNFSITDLAYGTYYWQVRAIDNVGNIGEWSLSKSVKTQDLIAPTTPGNVDYSVEENTVSVLWDASEDDALGSGLKEYTVQLSSNSDFSTIAKSVVVTDTETVISNLAGGEYYMRVGASDNAGNLSVWSAVQHFTIDTDIRNPIVITADSISKKYDGTEFTAGYSYTGTLEAGDRLVVTVTGSITDAGTAVSTISGYRIMRGDTDITAKYTNVTTVDGTLEVTKRSVTLTSGSKSWIWDGKAHSYENMTVTGDGFVSGEGADYRSFAEITEVGTTDNTFVYTLNGGTEAENYDIAVCTGTLEITPSPIPAVLSEDNSGISWKSASSNFTVAYSQNDFESNLTVETSGHALDTFGMPTGSYDWHVRNSDSEEWTRGEEISAVRATGPQALSSDADGNGDIFFASGSTVWESGYAAEHVGCGTWSGTGEQAELAGKNKITDVFEGSSDANILVMSDDASGDALFVDDIYSAFPAERQARIAQIDEIRAGDGDDIVDMTSQRFAYSGDGVTIRGGNGNDVIWANYGDNRLFGDAGDDRIAGASGNDVLVGGTGDDSLNGGGGDDIFCFCKGWGVDTVEQVSGGSVTLWFVSGSEDNWDQESMTYTAGKNSVHVTGVTSVTLKFGDDDSALYDELLADGAFTDASSSKIFEDDGKGIIAVL